MDTPALTALLPVVVLIVLGAAAAKLNWVRASAVKDLSLLVFYILTPALLFRTMASVRLADLDFQPIGVYFLAAGLIFAATMLADGMNTLAAARALAHTFSNTVMIGIPLVGLVYGSEGLVVLLTLISVHSLVLLGSGTIVFELAQARQTHASQGQQPLWFTLAQAIKNSIVHPVPLPIIAGLAFAQTGWTIPAVIDKPLQLLSQALGPMALMLVGVTLAYSQIGSLIRPALRISVVKIVLHPALMLGIGWLLGLQGLALCVMGLAAALPVGANVFMFTQRYGVGQEEVTASIAVSTGLCLVTLPAVLLLLQWLA